MKKLIIIAAMLALSGCSSQDNSSSAAEQTTTTTESTTTTTATSEEPPKEDSSQEPTDDRETVDFTADVLSLEENTITVSHEGKEYKLDLSECEYNSTIRGTDYPDITDRIINNPFGIKTKAELRCDLLLTKAYYCDAVTPNGSAAAASPDTGIPDNDRELVESYTVIGKGSCSVYDFTYFEKTDRGEYQADGRIDLSGSDIFLAPKFSEGSSINAMCFKFEEGNCFLALDPYTIETDKEEIKDEDGNVTDILHTYSAPLTDEYIYFGKVTETADNGKVSIELNGGSTCTLAPSVIIGCRSFSVGDTVMARFTEQPDYLEAPKQTDFDFAVIEKVSDFSKEDISISGGKVFVTDGYKKLQIIPETLVDADTLDTVTSTAGYTKASVPFEDMRAAYVEDSEFIYRVKTVLLSK